MEKLFNYIDGALVAPQNNQYIDNYDPSKGEIYALIPDSDATDVELAVKAAKAAFPSWSVTPKEERYKIIMRLVELIEQNLDMLAAAESKDNGKPLKLAQTVELALHMVACWVKPILAEECKVMKAGPIYFKMWNIQKPHSDTRICFLIPWYTTLTLCNCLNTE